MNTENTNEPILNSANSEQDCSSKTNEDNQQTNKPNKEWIIPTILHGGGLLLVCYFWIGWGIVFTILLWLVMVGAISVVIGTGKQLLHASPVDEKLSDWIVPGVALVIACGAFFLLTNRPAVSKETLASQDKEINQSLQPVSNPSINPELSDEEKKKADEMVKEWDKKQASKLPGPFGALFREIINMFPEKYRGIIAVSTGVFVLIGFVLMLLESIADSSAKRALANQTIENSKQNSKKMDINISKTAVEKKVLQIISNQFETSLDQVQKESSLTDDLKASSLGVAKFALELQNQFGIEIPDEEFEKIKTVGDAIACVQQEIKNNS